VYLADMSQGTVRPIELSDPRQPYSEWWSNEAAWSPDGQRLAVIMGWWWNRLRASKVVILEPESGNWHWLDLPSQFVDEIAWAPDGRHLLVKAGYEYAQSQPLPNAFWFIDATTGDFQPINLFALQYPSSGDYFMAWSSDGKRLAWVRGIPGGLGVFVSDVTIKQ
jgi:Tol biopolymer transport system component